MREATQFDKSERNKFGLIPETALCGEYGLPGLRREQYVPKNLIPFNFAVTEKRPADKWIHFFIDDYQFERVWSFPKRYISFLQRFKGIIGPDFSMFSDMPRAQRIWNCFRSRALMYLMQEAGAAVIPVIEWAEYSDLEWCMDGVPKNSSVAIGTYGCNDKGIKRYGLLKGVEKICRELQPCNLIIYGNELPSLRSLCGNVFFFENYCKTIKKRV